MWTRREFVRNSTALAGAFSATPVFRAFAADVGVPEALPYGDVKPTKDRSTGLNLLELPDGFDYWSFGWAGEPLSAGLPTPPRHDGMAAFQKDKHRVVLIRNHEIGGPLDPLQPMLNYDAKAGGGTTTLTFNTRTRQVEHSYVSLSGTFRNCAGGPTPWNTWLSCEETVDGPESLPGLEKPHGFVFEVPRDRPSLPIPITEMGRFVHEAAAVDPGTGIVYLTEDRYTAGFYRFVPNERSQLAKGGKLEMLAIRGHKAFETRKGLQNGEEFEVSWVPINDPTRAHATTNVGDALGVYAQGTELGAATFARLEGAWYAGGKIYFTATTGGEGMHGQIWSYVPSEERLRLIYESPSRSQLDNPDNLTISPRNGVLLCEDNGRDIRLQGITAAGKPFVFARNNTVLNGEVQGIQGDFRRAEFAGATFSPDGRWLFVNIQTPGISFAIRGPWASGPL